MGNKAHYWGRSIAALLTLFLLGGTARAGQSGIKDDAGFFGASAVAQAKGDLQQLQQKYNRTVIVETFAAPPADLQGKIDGNDASRTQAYEAFAQQRAYSLGADLYVMATKSPGHLETYARDAARTGLSSTGYDRFRADLLGYFKAKQFDQGLTNMTASLLATSANAPAAPRSGSQSSPPPLPAPSPQNDPAGRSIPGPTNGPAVPPMGLPGGSGGSGLFGMGGCMTGIILLVAVFFVIRIVRGLFGRSNQAPQGGYGGQPGYGGGYGQPGYGAPTQGGGFGRGLFGGLLGGLLGSWGGNQVFGQHHDSSNAGGGIDPAGGGHDLGSGGGHDLGAGGGDFGGGGDAGGGGADFGGGGDSGGGGGGGGDAGGGGGDF